jgi:hypothetical protein
LERNKEDTTVADQQKNESVAQTVSRIAKESDDHLVRTESSLKLLFNKARTDYLVRGFDSAMMRFYDMLVEEISAEAAKGMIGTEFKCVGLESNPAFEQLKPFLHDAAQLIANEGFRVFFRETKGTHIQVNAEDPNRIVIESERRREAVISVRWSAEELAKVPQKKTP